MEQLTKKEFLKLHKSKQLKLITSAFNMDKETIKKHIDIYLTKNKELPLKETSRVDVGDLGEYLKTMIFKQNNYIFVESHIDNSKSNNCSWNDKQVNTIAYLQV